MRLEVLYSLGSSVRAQRRESCAGAACLPQLAACVDQPQGLCGKTGALRPGRFLGPTRLNGRHVTWQGGELRISHLPAEVIVGD
jgi:hypothetical protein